jgi:hypothetical protein
MGRETPTLLGPLESAPVIEDSYFLGTNRVGAFLPTPEDGNRSSFRNFVLSSYLEFRMIDKGHKPSDSDKGRAYAQLASPSLLAGIYAYKLNYFYALDSSCFVQLKKETEAQKWSLKHYIRL